MSSGRIYELHFFGSAPQMERPEGGRFEEENRLMRQLEEIDEKRGLTFGEGMVQVLDSRTDEGPAQDETPLGTVDAAVVLARGGVGVEDLTEPLF